MSQSKEPTAKEIAENNMIDAMRWVVQEARAVKLIGTELPRGSRLVQALEMYDQMCAKLDATR